MNSFILIVQVLTATSFLCLIPVIKGPTHFDRLIGLNLLIMNTTVMIAVLAVQYGRHVYFDVALVYAVLGYVSVIAISKYLAGKEMHK